MQNTLPDTVRRALRLGAIPFLVILSACADTNGGLAADDPSFDELGVTLTDLQGQFTIGNDRLDPSFLPDTGDAVYNGVVSLVIDEGSAFVPNEDLELRGEMTVTANFMNDTISGFAESFSDSDFDTYSGSLTISGNILNNAAPGDPSILGGIGGGLTNDRTADLFTLQGTSGSPDAVFAGDFYGTGELYIGGTITGEIATPDETFLIGDSGTGTPDGSGLFVGAR